MCTIHVGTTCLGTNASGHKRAWAQTCLSTKGVWAQTCMGIVMYGHNREATIMSEHKSAWAQMCLGTNVWGHKRVWSQTCVGHSHVRGHSRVGTIRYEHKRGGTIRCFSFSKPFLIVIEN